MDSFLKDYIFFMEMALVSVIMVRGKRIPDAIYVLIRRGGFDLHNEDLERKAKLQVTGEP